VPEFLRDRTFPTGSRVSKDPLVLGCGVLAKQKGTCFVLSWATNHSIFPVSSIVGMQTFHSAYTDLSVTVARAMSFQVVLFLCTTNTPLDTHLHSHRWIETAAFWVYTCF